MNAKRTTTNYINNLSHLFDCMSKFLGSYRNRRCFMFEATSEFKASSLNCACLTEILFENKFLFKDMTKTENMLS